MYNTLTGTVSEVASVRRKGLFSVKLRLSLTLSAISTLLFVILLPLCSLARQTSTHAPLTREQFDALFDQVNNAERWGETDQKGTLNHITPDIRRMAAAEVRDGVTVSMAHELIGGPGQDASEPLQLRFMALSDTLLGPADGSVMWAMEQMGITFHGFTITLSTPCGTS